jgi:hypothetical protein
VWYLKKRYEEIPSSLYSWDFPKNFFESIDATGPMERISWLPLDSRTLGQKINTSPREMTKRRFVRSIGERESQRRYSMASRPWVSS